MALKYKTDTLDGLDEAMAGLYVQREDGGYVLDVELPEGHTVENVTGLKTAMAKANTEAKNAKAELKAFKTTLGDNDLTDVLANHQRMQELGSEADIEAKIEAGSAAKIEAMQRKHQQEIEQVRERADNARAQLEDLMIHKAVTKAIRDADGNDALLTPIVSQRVKMRESEDGRMVAVVLDAEGNEAIADGSGTPMSIGGLVAELKGMKEYQQAFNASGATGTGSKGSDDKGVRTDNNGVKIIPFGDNDAISDNIEAIAEGKAIVQPRTV